MPLAPNAGALPPLELLWIAGLELLVAGLALELLVAGLALELLVAGPALELLVAGPAVVPLAARALMEPAWKELPGFTLAAPLVGIGGEERPITDLGCGRWRGRGLCGVARGWKATRRMLPSRPWTAFDACKSNAVGVAAARERAPACEAEELPRFAVASPAISRRTAPAPAIAEMCGTVLRRVSSDLVGRV